MTITCAVDCGQTNYTGCNIIDDWVAVALDFSGNSEIIQGNQAFTQGGMNQYGMTVSFDGTFYHNVEMCTGTRGTEQFNITMTAGDCPQFKTIFLSCGLGRFRSGQSFIPELRVHDFDSIVKIDVSVLTPTPSTCTTLPPTTTTPCHTTTITTSVTSKQHKSNPYRAN